MNRLSRVYHPCTEWEELRHGMWSEITDHDEWLKKAIHFTGNHKRYGTWMRRVIIEWPISCENALTDYSINRKAWLGHAACALALGIPEDIVREAWGHLTDEQRLLANKEAEHAIMLWESNYIESKKICEFMGTKML